MTYGHAMQFAGGDKGGGGVPPNMANNHAFVWARAVWDKCLDYKRTSGCWLFLKSVGKHVADMPTSEKQTIQHVLCSQILTMAHRSGSGDRDSASTFFSKQEFLLGIQDGFWWPADTFSTNREFVLWEKIEILDSFVLVHQISLVERK